MMFVAHLEFTGLDLFPDYEEPADPQDNDFTYTYTYYDYLINDYRTDTFTYSCSVYYIVGSQSNGTSNDSGNQVSFWEDNNNYYNAWQQMYNSTIADLLYEAGSTTSVMSLCGGSFPIPLGTDSSGFEFQFLTIDIPVGYAIEYIQYDGYHSFFGCQYRINYQNNCDDEGEYQELYLQEFWIHSEGPDIRQRNTLYGGWENITVDLSLRIDSRIGYCFDSEGHSTSYDCQYDDGLYSVWPSSEYTFTLYYRFVPVIPVE
tara:strand:- start:124 stop:900 length:777 start_codon:yes stop_codon:yes gene_type:complete